MKPHPHLPSAFADLGIELALLEGLHKAGFETPTDIQREMIPLVLQGPGKLSIDHALTRYFNKKRQDQA